MAEDTGFVSTMAFGLTLLLLWVLRPIANHIGLVDHPGGRKQHAKPTPLIGGIAIITAFFLTALASGLPLSPFRALVVPQSVGRILTNRLIKKGFS